MLEGIREETIITYSQAVPCQLLRRTEKSHETYHSGESICFQYLTYLSVETQSGGSAVGIATRLGVGGSGDRIPAGAGDSLFSKTVQTSLWGPSSLLHIGYRSPFARVNRPGREVDHLVPSPKCLHGVDTKFYLFFLKDSNAMMLSHPDKNENKDQQAFPRNVCSLSWKNEDTFSDFLQLQWS
jgi:hypothetical protein